MAAARVLTAGAPLADARAALVMLHGRGAPAEDMLGLAAELALPGFAFLAPQAPGYTWYPNSFLGPIETNEPWLSSDLEMISGLFGSIARAGISTRQTAILGFSQGACLGLEFVARHPAAYGAAIGLSGGLIGPPATRFHYAGSLTGMPALLGCSDDDPHVPLWRVEETAEVFARMGAAVEKRIYPGLGHTVNADEVERARALLAPLSGDQPGPPLGG